MACRHGVTLSTCSFVQRVNPVYLYPAGLWFCSPYNCTLRDGCKSVRGTKSPQSHLDNIVEWGLLERKTKVQQALPESERGRTRKRKRRTVRSAPDLGDPTTVDQVVVWMSSKTCHPRNRTPCDASGVVTPTSRRTAVPTSPSSPRSAPM